ncbi:glycosyltransferase family 4 protein [Candidatus Daviesbacteria bacterium]|nr:glycosyltransferase family 4 protein [Candidatus Daviesbacteria bacterium]
MKIAILSRYQKVYSRGAENFVYELSSRLKKSHDVDILSGKDADNLALIISNKYDLVIPINGRSQSLKVSLGRLIGGKYKIIITGQSGIGKDDIWNIVVGKPDVFVALTKKAKKWAEAFAWGSKVVCIPNGVDLQKFNPSGNKHSFSSNKRKLNLPEGPIVLSVGALEWYKNHQQVIKAVSIMKDVSLVIVGEGPQRQELEQMGNEMLGSRFMILKASYKDMPSVYRSADVFTLPSWDREAFGLVYLEAMASNLPIVAPDDETRREIIEDAGVFVNIDDSENYAEGLRKALNANWQDKPLKQAKKYDWDKITQEYNDLILSLSNLK